MQLVKILSLLSLFLRGATCSQSLASAASSIPRAENAIPLVAKVPRRDYKRLSSRTRHPKSLDNLTVHVDGAAFESEYLVNITVGGQVFRVILDTGSSDIWVANKVFSCFALNGTAIPASACKFGPAQFDPTTSPTFQPFPNVTFLVQYGSGESLSGPAGFETIEVGGLAVPHQEFGVPNHNAFLGDGVSEGVLGLAFPGQTSVWNTTDTSNASGSNHLPYNPFFINAVQQGLVKQPYFSISLDRATLNQQENDLTDANLGLLAFGGIVPVPVLKNTSATVPVQGFAPNADGVFVPSNNASDPHFELIWYAITIDAYVFVGSDAVVTKSNNTLLDSGTTLNIVPSPVAAAYNALFSPPATLDFASHTYIVDCNAAAPAFSVVVGGIPFEIDARDQVLPFREDADGNTICMSGTQDGGPDVPGSTFILGDVFLHNVVAIHDPFAGEVTLVQREPY